MRAKVVDIAHKNDLNPDQLVAYAWEYEDEYDTSHPRLKDAVTNLENVSINAAKKKEIVKKFKYANRKGHDWRENKKLVRESLNESKINS